MISLAFVAAMSFAAPPTAADVDRLVQSAIDRWEVPGLALAVVERDKVVHLKGYGRRMLDAPAPVTPDTVFPLASCSKPFTAALLAALVDDGRLSWDDPVRKRWPDFRLKDPLASERATLRDLLCHRTGLGVHPLLWYHSPLSVDRRVRQLALLDPSADFRAAFQYQTIAFGAAGLAAERTAETSWQRLVAERILAPLGMSTSSAVEPERSDALAGPHLRGRDGAVRPTPRYSLRQPDPAGSIHATARDLAAFVRMQLEGGSFAGASVVSAPRIREMHSPNVVVPMDDFAARLNPETVQIGYGLGWIVQDYRGRKMVLHGGAIDGFRAHLALLPDQRLGIAVLSNLDGTLANFALANAIVDRFLEVPTRDWIGELHALEEADRLQDVKRAANLRKRRPKDAQPLAPLADYAGVYADPAYGRCEIAVVGQGLEFRWRTLRSPLEHFVGHIFLADEPPFRDAPLEFVPGRDGAVAELRFIGRTFARSPVGDEK